MGRVRGELILGQQSKPYLKKGKSLTHYRVRLFVETQNPKISCVIYRLEPSRYDSVLESLDASGQFDVIVTTYGDCFVTVDVQIEGELIRKVALLSLLLQESHATSADRHLETAIREIAEN